ncbi:hypothetical protein [Streptomyces sp. VNUA24]|uniref:hypothetical protein n=1 Tax=Streptomyces sp. VNUA24 TaxID=3031131 RepID=UPI0023B8552D|nr:hypothetical protein [Streptomyces sp. VNUA24]WEH16688.1 hypothetical protein PYR72_24420 [Streptomyces sp. VNUA24]
MTGPLNVLVLDDSPKPVLGTLNLYLEESPGDPGRFKLEALSDPARLDGFLDAHPGKFDVVLVDVDFELARTTHTCLTAFQTLIRRNGPQAVGLSTSHHGRTLFPFAVCQLLPPPSGRTVVGWAYKDDEGDRGYPELLRILDAIAARRPLTKPRTLIPCMPDADPATGQFMDTILPTLGDARLWALMSSTYYDTAQLAEGTSFVTSTITKRFRTYATAIKEFDQALRKSSVHPRWPGSRPLDEVHTGKTDPNQRIVAAFAQTHRIFFQAPELEEIVKARTARRSKLAGRRARRRTPEPWWKPHTA